MKRKLLFLLIFLASQCFFAQIFKYSLTSKFKAFQITNSDTDLVDWSPFKKTDVKILITESLCTVEEPENIKEYKILSSKIQFEPTRIQIQAVKDEVPYKIDLTLVDKRKFIFIIKGSNKIEIFKINTINKN